MSRHAWGKAPALTHTVSADCLIYTCLVNMFFCQTNAIVQTWTAVGTLVTIPVSVTITLTPGPPRSLSLSLSAKVGERPRAPKTGLQQQNAAAKRLPAHALMWRLQPCTRNVQPRMACAESATPLAGRCAALCCPDAHTR